MNKINKEKAEHYKWGNDCDGWKLLNKNEITIIHERMPPDTSEIKHYHKTARQFFFILEGRASIEIDDQTIILDKNDGIEILPGIKHRFFNSFDLPVEFIVTSIPPTLNDRIDI